jgi:hypothetical protein
MRSHCLSGSPANPNANFPTASEHREAMTMHKLNASIASIPLPHRLWARPISDTGYPVPWFVAAPCGEPDFRVADHHKLARALRFDLCWLCGQKLGRAKCFVIGPMCGVNRTTAEPPCHRDCAEYAIAACPFLAKPRMRRNEKDLPDDTRAPGGFMIRRNPGCVLLWITHVYSVIRTSGGPLMKIGEPLEIVAYAEGRRATWEELDASIQSGLPHLAKLAVEEGADAIRDFAASVERANALFKKMTFARAA